MRKSAAISRAPRGLDKKENMYRTNKNNVTPLHRVPLGFISEVKVAAYTGEFSALEQVEDGC